MDITADTPLGELATTHARLRAAWQAKKPDYAQRRADLLRLRDAVSTRADEFVAAISADFGQRSSHESRLTDLMVALDEIKHALAHLRRWMKPRRAAVGFKFWPGQACIQPEPVGVVGILSPWNYPVNLSLMPLASAIAAGNHVYLKPSEHTPRTSALLRELLIEVFPADRVAVALGGPEIGAAFAALPFDHLLFTGSTAVGRKVMAAAAPNLTPVTLELGGKAPALICTDFPIKTAAARIATGKWTNAGQTCIGVDYVLVDAARRDELVAALQSELRTRYEDLGHSPDYTRIINDAQYDRLRSYVDDARARGLQIVEPLPVNAETARRDRLFPPMLVLEPTPEAEVMQNEIFGPILPIVSYRTLDEAIAHINALERPLALYPFSHRRENIDRIVDRTLVGGITVNGTVLHFGVPNLPFGGVGPSGMGALHGQTGFDTFSKLLPIYRPSRWLVASDWIKPPYRGWIDKLVRLLTK